MSKIIPGTIEAHEKLTARLFFRPTGDDGFVDLGNVMSYKDATETQFRTHAAARSGARIVDNEQPDTIHLKYEFVLTETGELLTQMRTLATGGTLSTQAAVSAPAEERTVEGIVLGRAYDLSAAGMLSTTVERTGTPLPAGDYTLDAKNGIITFSADASLVNDGDDVDLTFGTPLRNTLSFTGNGQILFRGTVRFEEINQLGAEPLRTTEGEAVVTVSAMPEQTGEFGRATLRITFTAAPTVTRRHAA